MVEENIDQMTMKQQMEYWKKKAEGKGIEKEEPKEEESKHEKPIRKVFVSLGQNFNAKFTLWENNLQIVKSKKENDEWSDYQMISLSKRLLIELMTRIPSFVAEIESREKEGKSENE
jgi:hypothetical protein